MRYQSSLSLWMANARAEIGRNSRAVRQGGWTVGTIISLILGINAGWRPEFAFGTIWVLGFLAFITALLPQLYRALRLSVRVQEMIRWVAVVLALFCVVVLVIRSGLGEWWASAAIWGFAAAAFLVAMLFDFVLDEQNMQHLRRNPMQPWMRRLLFGTLVLFALAMPLLWGLLFAWIGYTISPWQP